MLMFALKTHFWYAQWISYLRVDVDWWRWVSCCPVLFDLMMMALQAIETHSITMKNLALFRPKLRNSYRTNQIARFGREQWCRILDPNDAVDQGCHLADLTAKFLDSGRFFQNPWPRKNDLAEKARLAEFWQQEEKPWINKATTIFG